MANLVVNAKMANLVVNAKMANPVVNAKMANLVVNADEFDMSEVGKYFAFKWIVPLS